MPSPSHSSGSGGLAHIAIPPSGATPRANLWIAVGGPAVNVILLIVGLVLFGLPDHEAMDAIALEGTSTFAGWIGVAMCVNVGILAFNLLPIFPMDGGRIFTSVMEICYGRIKGTWIGLGVTAASLLVVLPLFAYYGLLQGMVALAIVACLGVPEFISLLKKPSGTQSSDVLAAEEARQKILR